MAQIPPTYLTDSSGQQWLLATSNSGRITTTKVSGQLYAPLYTYLNSVTDGSSWQVSIVGTPPPSGYSTGQVRIASAVANLTYLTQLLAPSPNGTIYAIQIALSPVGATSYILETTLANNSPAITCTATIGSLAPNVLNRLEDPTGIFWLQSFEVYSALVEAINEYLLLVGRPLQQVNTQLNLQPNTVWQTLPTGLFAITDMLVNGKPIRQTSLYGLDYLQASWDSSWENDTADNGPYRWAPIGMTMFAVHPAPSVPVIATINGMAYPASTTAYPYTGNEIIPFNHVVFAALEEYAAHYCRIKEAGVELQQGLALYQNFLGLAQRMTEIEDRKDPLIWSAALGAPSGVRPLFER